MQEKKCGGCGKATNSWQEWFYCRHCGTDYCPDCYGDHLVQEEEDREMKKSRMKKMGYGDLEKKKRALCPKCDSFLNQRYSPDL